MVGEEDPVAVWVVAAEAVAGKKKSGNKALKFIASTVYLRTYLVLSNIITYEKVTS